MAGINLEKKTGLIHLLQFFRLAVALICMTFYLALLVAMTVVLLPCALLQSVGSKNEPAEEYDRYLEW